MSRPNTPAEAWTALREGNERFVAGNRAHPNQDADRRAELLGGQKPFALIVGCSDSRVAAEIVFDQGLGDLFVVRTAGHVLDNSVMGSLEFGVCHLGIPLVIVLGHDECGAVQATVDSFNSGTMPSGFLREVVLRITPSVLGLRQEGENTLSDYVVAHTRDMAHLIGQRSVAIAEKIENGECAIVGLNYQLADGEVSVVNTIGELG